MGHDEYLLIDFNAHLTEHIESLCNGAASITIIVVMSVD